MKKIFIVEDDKMQVEQLSLLLEELDYWVIGKSDNALDALSMIAEVHPDVVLLDVNIKGEKTGIELAEDIRQSNVDVNLIFLTSLDDDMTFDKAKRTTPFDFIIKPVTKRKLKRSLALCFENEVVIKSNDSASLTLKSEGTLYKVDLAELLYVEVKDKYCFFNLTGGSTPIKVRMAFSEILEKLESTKGFLQVHRSFIVNENHIRGFDVSMSRLIMDEDQVPVSKKFKENVEALFK